MPCTHGHQTRRVSPTDTEHSANPVPSSFSPSALNVELSALTVTSLRVRLRECNLPASGNKAALIERLQQSSTDDSTTQCDNPATGHTAPATQHERPTDLPVTSASRQYPPLCLPVIPL